MTFSVDNSGNYSKYNLKSHLGWMLGYRIPNWTFTTAFPTVTPTTLISSGFVDLYSPKYLYLVIDDHKNSSSSSSFMAYLPNGLTGKNIIAKISIDRTRSFGTVQQVNFHNGTLVSDTRQYTKDKMGIQKFNVQLINEFGNLVNLNQMDFAFSLKLIHT
jgi:hypothetical protein